MNPLRIEYIKANQGRFIEELRGLLKQSSITNQNRNVQGCAELLRKLMIDSGIRAEVMQVEGGNPVVYGEVGSRRSERTLLVYSHYDVQPPDPLEEWLCPPFSAEILENKIIARGASDSKGNIMTYLKAVETMSETGYDFPVNVKFLFEGEEEGGSPNLEKFVEENKKLLKADAVVCADQEHDSSGRPLISLGLKGILYVEFQCTNSQTDLHSMWAPLVESPAWRLIQALNTLRGANGRITVDGWYDDVEKPSVDDLYLLKEAPFSDKKVQANLRVKEFKSNLRGRAALKNLVFEPTCNLSGLLSGYTGVGAKTVLPSTAMAKVDFRLVPDQNPTQLFKRLEKHLNERGLSDVKAKLVASLEPSRTPANAPIARATIKAAEKVYGVEPVVYPNSPGSGPDYIFTRRLGLNSLWTGCSQPFSNAHAPNEFLAINAYIKGIEYAMAIVEEFRNI